jgi:hypothetical protein
MAGPAATIDAIVVATSAAAGGGVVLTSDIDDIRLLARPCRWQADSADTR